MTINSRKKSDSGNSKHDSPTNKEPVNLDSGKFEKRVMEMSLAKSDFVQRLISELKCSPNTAERFNLGANRTLDIVAFVNQPYSGVTSVFTNGVRFLKASVDVEFVFSYYHNDVPTSFDAMAFVVTYIELNYLKVFDVKQGDFLEVPGKLIKEFQFTGLYSTSACYFEQDSILKSRAPEVLWLIPIHQKELRYLRSCGYKRFEQELENRNPDLCDLNRDSMGV